MKEANIEDLLGKTLVRVDGRVGGDEIVFQTKDGATYKMFHSQDCCEQVSIDDIVGELDDLVGSPIVMAREDTNKGEGAKSNYDDSYTWTFYNLATAKGKVTIRWYGSSNGYYSESVDFMLEKEVKSSKKRVSP